MQIDKYKAEIERAEKAYKEDDLELLVWGMEPFQYRLLKELIYCSRLLKWGLPMPV